MSNRSFEGLDATLGGLHLRPPAFVAASDSLASVAAAMAADGVSCVIVSEPPLRVVTESDLVHALARGLGPEDQVAAAATEHPKWAPPSASVAEAAALTFGLANDPERIGPRVNRAQIQQNIEQTHFDGLMKTFGMWQDWKTGKLGRSE